MNTQKKSVQRLLVGIITSTALVLPLSLGAGSAQASMGSRDVQGHYQGRAAKMMGTQPAAEGIFPITHSAQPNAEHLTRAQRAINPVLNPDKPMNNGSSH